MIIDFRARPNTYEYMALYADERWERVWRRFNAAKPEPITLAQFVISLDDHGIDHAVFNGRQAFTTDGAYWGVPNDYVADCVRQYPDRLTGFGAIDVTRSAGEVSDEVRRCVEDLGLTGISIDPDLVGEPVDGERYFPAYSQAADLGVPVMLTVGPLIGPLADPWAIDRVAQRFPDLVIICAHGCWPWVDEFLAVGYRNDNVYFDVSIYFALPGAERVLEAAGGILRGRVLYGSGFPFQPLDIANYFRQARVPDEVMDELLFAKRVSIAATLRA